MSAALKPTPDQTPTMQFQVKRADLLPALTAAASATERRNTVPILGNVLFRLTAAALKITGTNLDTTISAVAEANISIEGATTLPASRLLKLVKALDADAVLDVSVRKDRAHISSVDFIATLLTMPAADFPVPVMPEWANEFTLSCADLRSIIMRTRFAISTEETRYYLNCIYFHLATNGDGVRRLKACATDGHRLALVEYDMPHGALNMPGCIVNRDTIAKLFPLLGAGDVHVAVNKDGSRIQFTVGSTAVHGKAIDGTFPEYQRVIPTENDKNLLIDKAGLSRAIERVSVLASPGSQPIKYNLSAGKLVLSAESSEYGFASQSLFTSYAGAPVEIGFNARYVRDILKVCGERVQFSIGDGSYACVITDPDDASATYVLMPMRV